MIMTTVHSNAWKHHPPAILNYSDEEYPSLKGSKKQCTNETEPMDNSSTNVNTAVNTLMMIDLDELHSAYETKCEAIWTQLQLQITEQCSEMEQMKHQLQQNFEQQLKQLELKMEMNLNSYSKTLDNAFRW